MCVNCQPLIKAIDAFLQKADRDLSDILADEGYLKSKETVEIMSELEEQITQLLLEETDLVLSETENAVDLETFAKDIWPGIKLDDPLREKLETVFWECFSAFVPEFAGYYLSDMEQGLKVTQVSKQTTDWVKSWSRELAEIMKLKSHEQIEKILVDGLEKGSGIAEFTRAIQESGIRNEYYRARRVAVTEVLTAHRAAKLEAILQSPSAEQKIWRHTGIYITEPRQNHIDMDGTKVLKTEPFELSGADGKTYYPMFPGDTNLPPGERIECHCAFDGVTNADILGLSLEERERLQQEALEEFDKEWEAKLKARNQAMVGFQE